METGFLLKRLHASQKGDIPFFLLNVLQGSAANVINIATYNYFTGDKMQTAEKDTELRA
ncbi:MAG TPA: hypothetical protein VJ951_08695 [Bacteroidales bacterium]|nr:hypothetical protein [Bacteroidales bacterium]